MFIVVITSFSLTLIVAMNLWALWAERRLAALRNEDYRTYWLERARAAPPEWE